MKENKTQLQKELNEKVQVLEHSMIRRQKEYESDELNAVKERLLPQQQSIINFYQRFNVSYICALERKISVRPDRTDWSRIPTGQEIILNIGFLEIIPVVSFQMKLDRSSSYVEWIKSIEPVSTLIFLLPVPLWWLICFISSNIDRFSLHLAYAIIFQVICPVGFRQKSGRIPDRIFFWNPAGITIRWTPSIIGQQLG